MNDNKPGSWPECPQRAFVEGATWWHYKAFGRTAFPIEREAMEEEAVRRYGVPVEEQTDE